jgi:integrase
MKLEAIREVAMSVEFSRFSLFKRKNGVYAILYYHHGHRRWKSTNTTTKPEALAVLSRFRELVDRGTPSTPLAEFQKQFLSFAEVTYSKGTAYLYRMVLTRFIQLVGNLYLVELTGEHFDRYRAHRLKERTEFKKHPGTRSVVSVNVELGTLKAAFSTAKRWGLLESNPFAECLLCPEPERTPAFFTAQDFEKLTHCIAERWLREVVIFAVLTGMRRGEILNLRWDQVDTSRRLVSIESGPTFKTKEGKRRLVPLNETALYLLKARRNLSASEYVFTMGDRRIDEDWLTHKFKGYVSKAGLDDKLHFHSLRHTFASWLVQDGATLYEVQKLLGHSSAKVTEVYSHLQAEQLHGTVERIRLN